jgi:hypothetical protein
VGRLSFPDPPRAEGGAVSPQAMGHWLTRLQNWGRELQGRVGTLEGADPEAAETDAADDGTSFASFAHISGNAGLAAHWNVANMASGGGLNTYYSPAANTLYATPFVAPRRGGSVIALGYDSDVATGNSRVALYTNTAPGTLYPAALLGETGSKANTAGATVVSATGLSLGPLTPGELYWLAYFNDNAAASVRKLDTTSCSGVLGGPLGQISTPPGIKVAQAFGPAPATFPAGGAYINSGSDSAPALLYRVGA